MMRLPCQRHQQAFAFPEEFSPGKAGHRIWRLQVHGVHEAGERHLGDGSHIKKIIPARDVLKHRMSLCIGYA
jgi:hypothetical protein